MILVDTSVWIDHLRSGDARLASLLEAGQVLAHPFVVGEIALGALRQRGEILTALSALPKTLTAEEEEVLKVIDGEHLPGAGIGYVDAHLLTSVLLTSDAVLWTRDRRLNAVAERMGLAMSGAAP